MLKKLLRARFGKDKESDVRDLKSPTDLVAGDLVAFKHRLTLPESLQGQTFEVTKVSTYEYQDGIYPQLTLDGAEIGRFYLSFKGNDPSELSLSRALGRRDVVRLFAEADFAALWDDDFVDLDVAQPLPAYAGWFGQRYSQVKKSAEGYFYDRDCRGETLSQNVDDDSEEFRYHECEDDSGRFGLTVEVWSDGETDVTLDVYVTPEVIEEMHPGDGKQ